MRDGSTFPVTPRGRTAIVVCSLYRFEAISITKTVVFVFRCREFWTLSKIINCGITIFARRITHLDLFVMERGFTAVST